MITKATKAEIAYRNLLNHSQTANVENRSVDEQIKELLCNLMHLSDEYAVDFDKEVVNAKVEYAHDVVSEAKTA